MLIIDFYKNSGTIYGPQKYLHGFMAWVELKRSLTIKSYFHPAISYKLDVLELIYSVSMFSLKICSFSPVQPVG